LGSTRGDGPLRRRKESPHLKLLFQLTRERGGGNWWRGGTKTTHYWCTARREDITSNLEERGLEVKRSSNVWEKGCQERVDLKEKKPAPRAKEAHYKKEDWVRDNGGHTGPHTGKPKKILSRG